jgi:lysophospholipase L1-like esterase
MQTRKIVIGIGVFLIIIAIIGTIIGFVFTPQFVQEHLATRHRIAQHSVDRILIFQQQMLWTSVVLGILGVLLFLFSNFLGKFVKKHRVFFTNIILLLVVFIICILFLEIIARGFLGKMIDAEQGGGPGSRKSPGTLTLNSKGYHDTEHTIIKPNGTERIIVLGDSFTYSAGIARVEDMYTGVLQERLNQKYGSGKFEVINLGIPGFNSADEVNMLRDNGLQYSPDIIVLQYYINDAEGIGSTKGFEGMMIEHFVYPYEIGAYLYERSYAYYLLESRIKALLWNMGFFHTSYQAYMLHLYSRENPYFAEHIQKEKEFIMIGRNANIPVIIFNMPDLTNFTPYPYMYINRFIGNVTVMNGGYYFDVLPSVSHYSPEQLFLNPNDRHMNVFASNISGTALFDFIQKNNLTESKK